ncbi:MAG TPA: hypothetical protein VF595_11820 [Tepidisphaeraceae bacterium]|jgi:hypothetical protein
MKINFWQVLGVILLLVGLIGLIYQRSAATPETTPPAPAPATAPAVAPAS